MARIARFHTAEGLVAHGILEDGGAIRAIAGDLFDTWELTKQAYALDKVKLLAPVAPPNILAIGLNYRLHALESGHELPDHPALFIKATTSLCHPGDAIVLPAVAPDEVDYECELAVIIGRKARNVSPDDAPDHVLGYTCANDVSARDCQRRLDVQWARAKSFDTFCPLGPWIETDLDPDHAGIRTRLNGQVMQDGNTDDLIFSVSELISHLSHSLTLLPGTVILTGTPPGVGFARSPQVFLRPGDVVEIEIDGIGVLRNPVVSAT